MSKQTFLGDEHWTDTYDDAGIRSRVFDRRPGAMLGASLHELSPGAPGFKLHLHYGAEEIFFVLSGTPTLRTGRTEERLSPGDVVVCPEGRDGLHTFTNPTDEPVRILAVSAGRFPDVVAYPEHGYAWVATRDPEFPPPEGGDEGIIARFELPTDPPATS
jgi:uncharacterized cupin superfamily protein